MGRTIIVANRLPVTVSADHENIRVKPSVGGVASCLAAIHRPPGTRWIGWTGFPLEREASLNDAIRSRLYSLGHVPVFLTDAEIGGYYSELSNAALWPLLHSLLNEVPIHVNGWTTYCEVNERFAETVAADYMPGDLVWIHDYQLALVPAYVRRRLPGARIGFFLHVPFPPFAILRAFPWWRELVTGMLGADLIGFQTEEFAENFREAASRVDGLGAMNGHSPIDTEIGIFPVGVNADEWQQRADDPEVLANAQAIRREATGRKLLLAVDRLDYTKGIPRRLAAFEELFARGRLDPEKAVLYQVSVPSRGEITAYEAVTRRVEEAVGRINSRFGGLDTVPVRSSYQAMDPAQLAALYRAADVMLVTSLNDGMNLVCKEFVASRSDGDGVLVLSEFAGAARELTDALIVNPYDVSGMARTIQRAMTMTAAERQHRMARMRAVVQANRTERWAVHSLSVFSRLTLATDPLSGALRMPQHRVWGPFPIPSDAARSLFPSRLTSGSDPWACDREG